MTTISQVKLIIFAFATLLSSTFTQAQTHTRTLFFGDSHVAGPFGKTLDHLLNTDSASGLVTTIGMCGTIAGDYIKGATTDCGYFYHDPNTLVSPDDHDNGRIQKIETLFHSIKPTRIIVELGSNYGDSDWKKSAIIKDIESLVKLIRKTGAECVWVTMPDTRLYHSREPIIKEATVLALHGVCRMIDSSKLTVYPSDPNCTDGLHYECGPESEHIAQNWAQEVFQKLNFK
jgi:hypothetical protein